MKNKIVFDLLFAQPNGASKFHGGGEYIKTVFKALVDMQKDNGNLTVCFDTDVFLDEWILETIKENRITVRDVKSAKDIVAYICEEAAKGSVRFFAGMIYPYENFTSPKNVTCVGTCHGLRFIEKAYDTYAPYYIKSLRELKDLIKNVFFFKKMARHNRALYQKALDRFDIVVTVSEHSAWCIKVNFPELAANKKINVFYTPAKYIEPLKNEDRANFHPYILMVSADRWLKNSYRGVMALDRLYQKGCLKGIKTKVLGNLPEQIHKRVKCKECFEFLGYVSTEDLEKAYRDCELFFYPTLNEGFGLPPMEAMKYGKTCVISAVCSLPEVYGDSVYYCNPYDIMEMQGRILNALDKKIDVCKIEERLKLVHDRQEKDLEKLCQLILG